ncbi:type IV pilus assembly protein PilM [Jatrophihabitans sp. YIM 134969]
MTRIEMPRLGRRVPTATGLDLGSTAVRAFEISHRPSGPVVENYGSVAVSPGAVRGGVVEDGKAVTSAVRELWSHRRFRSRKVMLGLSHQQVLVRDLTVPKLDARDLRRALPYLVRETLPFPVDQALLDFHALGPAADGSGGIDGLVVAAPKDAVVQAVEAVQRAGLFVEGVDLASFAAMRATATGNGSAEIVVDIGAYCTNLVIHVDGVPQVVRCVPRGGAEVTALLALRHDLSIDDAETLKCQVGLVGRPGVVDDVDFVGTVGEALRPLFREIRSSVSWFANHREQIPVSQITLCGGGSLLPGLVDSVQRRLELPTRIADPLAQMRTGRGDGGRHAALDRLGSTAAVSIGLTLGVS